MRPKDLAGVVFYGAGLFLFGYGLAVAGAVVVREVVKGNARPVRAECDKSCEFCGNDTGAYHTCLDCLESGGEPD